VFAEYFVVPSLKLVPLGDQAVLAYLPDETAAVRFAAAVRAAAPPWLQDVVPAYASVGVFFDADLISLSEVMRWLRLWEGKASAEPGFLTSPREGEVAAQPRVGGQSFPGEGPTTPHTNPPPQGGRGPEVRQEPHPPKQHRIPVCYELQHDMARVCEHTGLTAGEVIHLHTAAEFTVYAVGFVAGFPYLGYLPQQLCGVPRLESPRPRVEPGSVGLTGRQTGIYPVPRPGGWNLIGRTPLVIVDVAGGFFPLRVGDSVRFERIDSESFRRREGERLGIGD
jgi:inhibitor of KinA